MNVTLFENAYLQRVETIIQSEEFNLRVASALRFVIQNVFLQIANSFTITISSGEGPVEFWLHDVMRKLFTTWGFMALNLMVLDKKLKHINLPGKRYCNLIMIDNFKSLEKANIAEYNDIYDSLEYYFIFLQITDDRIDTEMKKIFQYCFDNYWINCNVMIQNSDGNIFIYTYFPYQEGQCFQTKPALINKFLVDRFASNVMFPDKLKNLFQCPLKLCTWKEPPFIMMKPDVKFPKQQISGFEMTMINTISETMNFSIDIQLIEISNYPNENFSFASGPLGYLKNRRTNITMGYFQRTVERDKIATPSFVTYYLPLVAIVLLKQHQHEPVGILTFPFDKTTWLLLAFSCGSIFVLNALQRKLNRGYTVNNFIIFEVLIGVPINILPQGTSRRIRLVIWMLSSFVLRSVYQSLLFYLYRTNFYLAPPETFEALAATGYKTICVELSREYLLYVPQILDGTLPLISLNSSDELEALRYVERRPTENLAAISIPDLAYYYVATEMDDGNSLVVLPINVNDQQIGIYLPKHSYLIKRFNDCIMHFHQAGLLESWRKWTNYANKVTRRTGPVGSYEHELMTNLKQLNGFLMLTMVLYLIAFALFLLELISTKIIWLQTFF